MLAWENDLQIHWDLERWQTYFSRSYKDIRNISLIEASLKVMTRLYFTPSKLATTFPLANPQCNRECQLIGSMAYI